METLHDVANSGMVVGEADSAILVSKFEYADHADLVDENAALASTRVISLATGSMMDAAMLISIKKSKAMHVHMPLRVDATTEADVKVKVWFYIALYPVRWTAQSALHFPPLADLFIPTPFSASLGSILAMQQLRNDYSLIFPPLSIARYSFIQLSRLMRREVKENAQTAKR